jgi:hypothetical protein
MENQELNSNAKLTSFSQEEATPVIKDSNNQTQSNKESINIGDKDIVSRPLLWGLVVFLVFFSLVVGGTSVYRIYQDNMVVEEEVSTTPSDITETLIPNTAVKDTAPVSSDPAQEAIVVESEIQSIDSNLEENVYSDEALGL